MDALEYQKKMAEYDERISFYKAKAAEAEYQKSSFNLQVMTATHHDYVSKNRSNTDMNGGVEVVTEGTTRAG